MNKLWEVALHNGSGLFSAKVPRRGNITVALIFIDAIIGDGYEEVAPSVIHLPFFSLFFSPLFSLSPFEVSRVARNCCVIILTMRLLFVPGKQRRLYFSAAPLLHVSNTRINFTLFTRSLGNCGYIS